MRKPHRHKENTAPVLLAVCVLRRCLAMDLDVIISSSHLLLYLQSGFFHSGLPINILKRTFFLGILGVRYSEITGGSQRM
jgi:hypothetical protein